MIVSRTLWEEEAGLSHAECICNRSTWHTEGSIYLLNDYVNDYLYVFIRERGQEGLECPEETPRRK